MHKPLLENQKPPHTAALPSAKQIVDGTDAIKKILAADGWTMTVGAPSAWRMFETAVGERMAVVWFAEPARGSCTRVLRAEYQSEGRNVLASCIELLASDATTATVETVTQRFLAELHKHINASYARRLHLIGVTA